MRADRVGSLRSEEVAEFRMGLLPGPVNFQDLPFPGGGQDGQDPAAAGFAPCDQASGLERFQVAGQRRTVDAEKPGNPGGGSGRSVRNGGQKLALREFQAKRSHMPVEVPGEQIGRPPGRMAETGPAHMDEVDILKGRRHLL